MPLVPHADEPEVEEAEEPGLGNVLFRFVCYLWGEAGRWLRIAIFIAAGALFLILGMALTGIPALVALTALAPLVALLLVPVRINPMWLLAVAAWPDRILANKERRIPILREGIPLGGGELRRGTRWVFALVAVEVGMAFYYAGVEYLAPSVDRTLVLVTFALFVLLALVAASPTSKVRTRALEVLSVVFVLLTVLFLFGGKHEFGGKLKAIGNNDAKAAPAEVEENEAPVTRRVTLRGPGVWVSTGINLDRLPGGVHYSLDGPTGAKVRFVDEEDNVLAEGPITQNFGILGGTPEFSGRAGATATLRRTTN